MSFLTHQVAEIRDMVDDDFEDLKIKHEIFVATPEEFQGNERDVMFITLGLHTTCDPLTDMKCMSTCSPASKKRGKRVHQHMPVQGLLAWVACNEHLQPIAVDGNETCKGRICCSPWMSASAIRLA